MNYWALSLSLTGIKPRDRKAKRHNIDLGKIPDTGEAPIFSETLINEAKLLTNRFKNIQSKVLIVACPIVEKNYGDHTMVERMIFNPRQTSMEVIL